MKKDAIITVLGSKLDFIRQEKQKNPLGLTKEQKLLLHKNIANLRWQQRNKQLGQELQDWSESEQIISLVEGFLKEKQV